MKTKVVPFLFVITIIALAGIFFASKKNFFKDENSVTRAKIVTPKNSENAETESEKRTTLAESEKHETFVPLYAGEVLISALTIDMNNDGYDDEAIVVRKSNSQNLNIVVALMSPETGVYKRLPAIPTEFTRTRTFSYTGMDIAGEHKTALIYQGVNNQGDYVMKIFHCNTNADGTSALVNIGDFSCDGTIFIQQTERSDSYLLSMSKGESFSVWVYKSENSEDSNGAKTNANQIQQEYKWNPASQKYELAREIRVPAGRLAAKALSGIQDGTVETFASFLNGLWYKTSNEDSNIRYLYFNYAEKEIVQLFADTQEVYEWEDSKIRHNGIYLTAINADIMNLHRRFDIALVNIDEIKVTLRDEVNLLIKENTLWDGQYKKMSIQRAFNVTNSNALQEFSKELKKSQWKSSDIMASITFDDYSYSLQKENSAETETGVYALQKIGNYNVIQFLSDSEFSVLNETYSIEFGEKTITERRQNRTTEKSVVDYDSIIFAPVKITTTDCFASEGKIFTLNKVEQTENS